MEDRRVRYVVVDTFESAHSAALCQVEMLVRGVTAHVWPNDDPTPDSFEAWFVIVPDDQAELARQAMARPPIGVPPPVHIPVNGTAD